MRLYPQYDSWDNPKDPDRPLVIGYVSPDYFTHSVSYFIEAPLIYHDYGKYQVVVYSAVADAKTNRFREKVIRKGGVWRDIYGIDEKQVASMVRDDKIDILVELTGHTANNKLGTMACRPAPVQVTWIGYPNTTGLLTIDYRITDSLADPPGTKQKHVEKLVRLPECFLCYTPSSEAGPVSPTPSLSNGFITFGSFNNLAKITPKVLRVWARMLCAIPNSRLVVKCKPFCCDSVRQKFLTTLEELRIPSLDTFPYAGTTTTCESLYMGVPCVTMVGSVHAHNVGVSLLSKVGLGHLIAKNEDECNFISGLEVAYRGLWHRYCKDDIPFLRHMEMLKQEGIPEEPTIETIESERVTISKDNSQGSKESNGFNQAPLAMLNPTTLEDNRKLS
ncbi:putative UDP-N-acetylglucosamine--peptide N-acetylglucosaminyltransferase SPINDLY [Hibiscus syriacus]|uniref:UDP-N-acetylglucosamine--peptide N-acetylglucosaminyltransferase SPINDLY n=1 Tax=Hibiscus syriacus TaxID=106335 RepID=A0A6A3CV29_HIBSY|nr:putative UDP-N-acetylglucosamine--peptide N-acetylglucosaminyltransferase SPINDLY [Hibiscus syriacus]